MDELLFARSDERQPPPATVVASVAVDDGIVEFLDVGR
jgi:hypothetical protein